jgi:hypothetical protein
LKALLSRVVIPTIAFVRASFSSSRAHLCTVNASSVYVLQVDEFVKHYCYGFEVFVEHAKVEDYRSSLVMHPEPMKSPASGKSVWKKLG